MMARCTRPTPTSPPSRGRGLKRQAPMGYPQKSCVAPFTGAWIETSHSQAGWSVFRSPPSRGRGLKHRHQCYQTACELSPPSRGRGLKRPATRQTEKRPTVAPFTGAWIETLTAGFGWLPRPSPPSRGRGLKQRRNCRRLANGMSPPSRGRGLKHLHGRNQKCWQGVAPFTGAWIETLRSCQALFDAVVAPFTGAWYERRNENQKSVDWQFTCEDARVRLKRLYPQF